MLRQFSLISLLICFLGANAQASQYPDNNAYLSQPYSASTITETYLTPYDNAEARLIAFLDQAKHYCYVASYSITNRNIVYKLIQLHNRGIDVQVITDRTQAAGRSEQAALAALSTNGISICAGRSVENALMHCKFCVIDDHLVEDGSWNFTASASREDNILNFTNSPQRAAQFLAFWRKIKMDMTY